MFGRKKASQQSTTLLSGPYAGVLPANQVRARLRVAAVTPPGRQLTGDAVLVSGILLGAFQVVLVQVTAALPRASWPAPGQELPAVADPMNPMRFAVVWWSGMQANGASAPNDPAQWNDAGAVGWDGGPGGAHTQAIADWLAANGFTPGDFGPALAVTSPELPALLTAACARYATVIAGHDALALMRTGQPAQGVVAALTPLPMPVEMLPSPSASMAWLTLDVTPAAGTPYRCTIRFGFRSPERLAAIATVGTSLPLRVDPADRRRVTIDLPALGIVPG